MSLKLIHPTLRAAARERLLTCVDVDHAPGVSVTLAQTNGLGVFTRASGSWLTAGFAAGQEVTVTGWGGHVGIVQSVSALALTTDIAGSGTVAGGGNFQVALPSSRAWEGISFTPTSGKPHVIETFRPVSTIGRSIGNTAANGTIEHKINAITSLFYPAELGTLAIERMAGALMDHFRRGVDLSRDGMRGVVEQIGRSPLMTDNGWLQVAVTAQLLAFTQD